MPWRAAEVSVALFADPFQDALRALYHAGRRDALREVGYKGPRGVAARVVRAVRAIGRRVPCEAAEAARRRGKSAPWLACSRKSSFIEESLLC